MMKLEQHTRDMILQLYQSGIKPLLVREDDVMYLRDPVVRVRRYRVVAELVKTLVRLKLQEEKGVVDQLCAFLLRGQNEDGSWNELHPHYDQPSALVTSLVGEALLLVYHVTPRAEWEQPLEKARDYVLSMEDTPGYFIKSRLYREDHLNVDAACGSFVSLYDEVFSDQQCREAAVRAARHVCDHQQMDGSYPYRVGKQGSAYLFNVPCVHYQGVTLHYLCGIAPALEEPWFVESVQRGGRWLVERQRESGRFDWSGSGLMLALYLTGAYGFACSSFLFLSRFDERFTEYAQRCLGMLARNMNGLCLRWEKDSWWSLPGAVPVSLASACFNGFPLRHRVFLLGYRLYREVARRRYACVLDDRLFHGLVERFGWTVSTVEPFANYPDVFMTTEVMECLSAHLT